MNFHKLPNSLLAYHCARIAMGLSFFMHGFVRVPKWGEFSQTTAEQFAGTAFPESIAFGFASVIIIVEVVAGIMLLVGGKYVRIACAVSILYLGLLMFGSGILENWGAVQSQLVHLIVFYIILTNKHTQNPYVQ